MTTSTYHQPRTSPACEQGALALAGRHERPVFHDFGAGQGAGSVKPFTAWPELNSWQDSEESEAIMCLTPALLSVMTEVADFISVAVQHASQEERSGRLRRTAKKMLEKVHLIPRQAAAPLLSLAQLAQARQLAFQKARELHLSEAEAERLVDAVVGRPGA